MAGTPEVRLLGSFVPSKHKEVLMAAPAVPKTPPPSATKGTHGKVRGLEQTHRSTELEGRFGRMFRTLPPAAFSEADVPALMKLGEMMTAEAEDEPTPETKADDEENTGISAGYTYLGQFIDHDITFDPASSLQKQDDPDSLVDFRTPRFDLDNLYGRGPDDQPYLYRDDGKHMLLGDKLTGNDSDPNARGVPRNHPKTGERGRALLGDPRNDENVIVSQLQASMLRFHNRVLDFLGNDATFEQAQQFVRWHYQWVVLNDFLPTIIGETTWKSILPHIAKGTTVLQDPPDLKFYKPKKEAFIPVEFSVAAYRFGHSMVRPIYRLNQKIPRFPIFAAKPPSLTGFDSFPLNWAIEWNLFFKVGNPPPFGTGRLQPAYKIDTSLVNPLGNLPAVVAAHPSSLPQRNLLRGFRMCLPSGQAVAQLMGETPIPDDKLRVGKATEDDDKGNPKLVDISPVFENNAPLWFYVLAEAQQQFKNNETPIRMGPVGGRIVGEVIVGLMWNDSHSFLRQSPLFQPFQKFQANGKFGMADLLHQATLSEPQPD
jgi:Animal haem peroxidase